MTIASVSLHAPPKSDVYRIAREARATGISVIPIRADGTKQPALASWRQYQQRRASEEELAHWFRTSELGMAFVTGAISGNLEALDFDDSGTFEAWRCAIGQSLPLAALYDVLSWGYLESTPAGGWHILYRCPMIQGNQKLASRPDGQTRKTLIETRGEGGLIIVAPSGGQVHPSGKPYLLLRGGISSIRTITVHQRSLLLASARQFDELPPMDRACLPPRSPQHASSKANGQRPGDLFNQGVTWEEVLSPHGWQIISTRDGVGYWRRPGKSEGISATTNYGGDDLLYVFSTSTVFEAHKTYSKFYAYALLNHHGDCSAAARELMLSRGGP